MNELTEVLARTFFDAVPQDVLVIGCGIGRFAEQLSSMGHRVWACQESLSLTLQLQHRAEGRSEVDFFTADPLHMQPFSDNFFDAVVIEEEVGCNENVSALFEEACRVVGRGGQVLGTYLLPEHSPRRQRRVFDFESFGDFVQRFGVPQSVRCEATGFVFWIDVRGGSHD